MGETTPAQMSEGDYLFSRVGYFIRIQGQKFLSLVSSLYNSFEQLDLKIHQR